MSYPPQLSRTWIEKLMEISTALGDYTQTAAQCSKIPNYLSRALGLGPVTLAIVDASVEDAPQIALMTSSVAPVTREGLPFGAEILAVYHSTLAAWSEKTLTSDTKEGRASRDVLHASVPMGVPGFPLAMVFAQEMDDSHRMLLIVHQPAEEITVVDEVHDTLLLIASQLSKLLRCMVACSSGTNILGGRFNRLTEREWMVLRVLNSEDGEKQLADRLSLSPHTLHSHIKSIYRKVGVQGRLALLLRLREAQQELRLATLSTPVDAAHMQNVFAMN
jgi:DNA-binding CsgD family transcriptional regulator